MKKIVLFTASMICLNLSTFAANIIVNGGFDTAVGMWETGYLDPDSMQNGAPNAIDAGWVAQGSPAASTWDTVAGLGTRSAVTDSGSYGIAQIISNPSDTTFDNGDSVTVSFDYDIGGTRTVGFNYRLFGIETTSGGAWAGSAGIKLNLPLDANVPGVANGYTYTQLDNIAPILTAVAGGTYSMDVTLAKQYEHFAIVFFTDLDGGSVTIDNVSLEPSGATLAKGSLFIISCITPHF